jgi:outer membrane biosynthesis protein TonB
MPSTVRMQVVVALLALVAASGAQAQVTREQQDAIRASCRSDFMSRCSGVTPGGRDALQCLQKNVSQLSPACQSAVKVTMPAPAPAAAPPPAPERAVAPAQPAAPAAPATTPAQTTTAPAETPVPAAKSAKPATRPKPKPAAAQPPAQAAPSPTATAQPAPQTSPTPTMPKAPAVTAAVVLRACKLDLLRHCNGVPVGGGRIVACLTEHERDLTIRCRTALNVEKPLR